MSNVPFAEQLSECVRRFAPVSRWALTCGTALALHGLPYAPHDLDFFAGRNDAYRLTAELHDCDVVFPLAWRASGVFASHFGRYLIDGIEIDVVGDFSVLNQGHTYVWDTAHPCWDRLRVMIVSGLSVPVFSLEDLLVTYLALPDEDAKVKLICEALAGTECDRNYLRQQLRPELLSHGALGQLALSEVGQKNPST